MFIFVLITLGLFALLQVVIQTSQPFYQARPLSHWLAIYSDDATPKEEKIYARNAVLSIGTNALPYVMEQLRRDTPDWRRKIYRRTTKPIRTNEFFESFFNGEGQNAYEAMMAFSLLGSNLQAAVPELTVLLNNTNRRISDRAIFALCAIGEKGFPILTNALAETNRPNRVALVAHIGWMSDEVGTNTVLPTLLNALNDDDPRVREKAKQVLLTISPVTITNQTQ
ncbi:MAG: HEAT repeat domain-containing protein [Verrucomicrobiota bacterium]|nr:HEAT repeat domain-containing protein [Verrucomicrobiota bacterium]